MTPPTKLQHGRDNLVTPSSYIPTEGLLFDAAALYCYLLECAEHELTPGTPTEVRRLFEREFAPNGGVPDTLMADIEQRYREAGIASMPEQDDIRRDAAVSLFSIEYARAYATNPQGLPNPRGVPLQTTTPTRIDRYVNRLRRFIFG